MQRLSGGLHPQYGTASAVPFSLGADLSLSTLLLAALPLAWLVPNHYFPWLSAWGEGLSLALLALAALAQRGAVRMPVIWAAWVGIALATVLGQWAFGELLYRGDALMVALYLAAFALAIALGSGLGTREVDAIAVGVLGCAIASVGIAVAQWLRVTAGGLYVADLPPAWRPFGNLAQPNHLCTATFLGLCSLALLFETRRVGRAGLAVGGGFLLFGMVMTGSRTGWLQLIAGLLLLAAWQRRVVLRLRVRRLVWLFPAFVALTISWPSLNRFLMLDAGRSLGDEMQAGVRIPLWWSLLDAVHRSPLIGYGWMQAEAAQAAVALDHAPIQRPFSFTHNLLLDFLIWVGIPAAIVLLVLGATALARLARGVGDARSVWLLVGVAGVLVHAMLEYPLAYAYFLLPVGVVLGAVSARVPVRGIIALRAGSQRIAGGMLALLLCPIAFEYLQAEQSMRTLQLEDAHIGVTHVVSKAPHLVMLDQLGAFLSYMATEARPAMSESELEAARRVAERYPGPPVLLRYALAAGLNGHPHDATVALARICRMHSPRRCDEARVGWQTLQSRYPQLSVVPAP
ncbi:MAG: O-antigen ligase C-terminal domain-containing protein [Burkholderiales bacterium]|nr:O-antigen ligase C-terminal domain-containing protein [Burkholderiales bacterium]